MTDMTPSRRALLRQDRSHGYVDAIAGAGYGTRLAGSGDEARQIAYDTGWHVGRQEKLGIPAPPGINPTDAEDYAKGLYCEEAGESLTVLGSGMRFGDDTPGRDDAGGDSPRRTLAKEMGDVLAAIEYACRSGLVDRQAMETARERKLAKLLSPLSRDNLGRRLAPPPLGYDEPVADQLVPMTHLPDYAGPADPSVLIGRRIIRYMPELATEFPDDVFAAWQLDDQDTWIVLAHPDAGRHVRITDDLDLGDMTFIDVEIVSMSVERDGFRIIAVHRQETTEAIEWSLSPQCVLGPGDDLRAGLVLLRRPPEYRDR